MIVGVPRETKADEYRVGLLPVGAELLTREGHTVLFQRSAGVGSGFDDAAYAAAGARVIDSPEEIYAGADLIPGGRAPMLMDRAMVHDMKNGAVIVDVCIDQGGCIETSRPTTHGEPTYVVDGVVHYCVANIPGAVSRTSSQALCNATLLYVRELARLGPIAFGQVDPGHAAAINMKAGKITNPAVAEAFPDLPRE